MKWALGITWVLLVANLVVACSSTDKVVGQYLQLKRVHEVAATNQGQSICYEMSDSNHIVDGWFCLNYWGKASKDIPGGGGADDDDQYANIINRAKPQALILRY